MTRDGRVRVGVRLRPLLPYEINDTTRDHTKCVAVDEHERTVTLEIVDESRTFAFGYDAVYGGAATQEEVYNSIARTPLVSSALFRGEFCATLLMFMVR